jgi:hypothetical protein
VDSKSLETYLQGRAGAPVEIVEMRDLGGEAQGQRALKQFGFGRPLLVAYRSQDGEQRVVFHRIRRNAFGREREDDRAAAVWLDYRTFNRLPRHVPAVDMVVRTKAGEIRSIGDAEELLLVSGFRPGQPYAQDLLRIREKGESDDLDLKRAAALARCAAGFHADQHDDPLLWRRRLRDLIGHGEGIFGITDSYSSEASYAPPELLRRIEEAANRWRWRLKEKSQRLRRVHGDFHPFNILFREGLELVLLDRSRGDWGEPADDVSSMALNYIFFSLQRSGKFQGPFQRLHDAFWEAYFDARSDPEMTAVIQPWFAWRALVLASPVWYPDIEEDVRVKLLTFAQRVLVEDVYEPGRINEYLGAV